MVKKSKSLEERPKLGTLVATSANEIHRSYRWIVMTVTFGLSADQVLFRSRAGTKDNSKEQDLQMKAKKNIDRVTLKRWPELKKRAQSEQNLVKLMALLVEIDELLFDLETRVRVIDDAGFNARAESQSVAIKEQNE